MKFETTRKWSLSSRDVAEAVCAWLKQSGQSSPDYVGDTPTTKWEWKADGGVVVIETNSTGD